MSGRVAARWYLWTAIVGLLSCGGGDGITGLTDTVIASLTIVSGDPQTGTVGKELPNPLVVEVKNAAGVPLPNQIVNFRVTVGGGTVFAGAAQTNSQGIAQERWTLGTVAGDTQRVEVRAVDPSTGQAIVYATFRAVGTADVPASITKVAGDGGTGGVATTVVTAPQVRVTDQYANPVPGATVTFSVTSGGGTVSGATQVTDAAGLATVGGWTLGATAGAQTLTATVTGIAPAVFTVTSVPGAASVIATNSGSTTGTAGSPVATPPSVIVKDAHGNPVAGISVTFAVASGGGSLTNPIQVTNSSGIAQVSSWTLGATAGTNTLTAAAPGLNGSPVVFTATGNAGPAAKLMMIAGPSSSTPNRTQFSAQPVLQLTDAHNNAVSQPGVTVTAAITAGGGTLNGTTAVATASDGKATFTNLSIAGTVGTRTLTFSAPGVASVTANISLTAGAATTMTTSAGQSQTTFVTIAVPTPPSVKVSDIDGNGVPGFGVTFAVASGGGSITGANTPTNSSGIAQVESWTLGPSDGNNTLTASGIGLSGSPITFSATAIRFKSITVFGEQACAVRTGGAAYCWGSNGDGQLGDGTTQSRTTATRVSGNVAFDTVVAAGSHTCGLTPNGAAYCWGRNVAGQLGDGTRTARLTPTAVTGGLTFKSISVPPWTYTCALTAAGSTYCWGDYENGGEPSANPLGHTSPQAFAAPAFQQSTAGKNYSCGLTGSETYCWGIDRTGRLWPGGREVNKEPTRSGPDYAFTDLMLRPEPCGLTSSGSVYCWGVGFDPPALIGGGLQFESLADRATCGLTAGGKAYCWGRNEWGQIGDGATILERSEPVAVSGNHSFAGVSGDANTRCGVTTSGVAYCWGRNTVGQLGDGTQTPRSTPTLVRF